MISLDDEVMERLRFNAERQGRPLNAVVEEMIRAELDRSGSDERTPFRVPARPMGLLPGIDLDSIGRLLEQLEGPAYR